MQLCSRSLPTSRVVNTFGPRALLFRLRAIVLVDIAASSLQTQTKLLAAMCTSKYIVSSAVASMGQGGQLPPQSWALPPNLVLPRSQP